MTSFCGTNDDVLTVSYEVSVLIAAKKLKPYNNGAWAKELLIKAAEKLALKSVYLYQKLSLFPLTVSELIKKWVKILKIISKKLINLLASPSVLMKQRTSRTLGSSQYFFEG